VLIISLLILLVMTLIGVTAMQTTTLEEKMAGNTRDRNTAFQATEAALRDAEALIEGAVTTGAFDGSGGLYGTGDTEPDYASSTSWSTANSRAYSGSLAYVATQPRYFVKQVGIIPGAGGPLNIGGYGKPRTGADVTTFRITARGTGTSDTSRVTLRSYYGKIF